MSAAFDDDFTVARRVAVLRMLDVIEAAAEYAKQHVDEHEQAVALRFVRDLTDQEVVHLLAARGLADAIRHDRRLVQLRVERRAADEVAELRREREVAVEQEHARWQAIYDNPLDPMHLLNGRDRQKFRRWCGDRFDEWYKRLLAGVTDDPKDTRWWAQRANVEADWHPEGPMAYYRDQSARRIWDMVQATADQVRLEVTEELLGSQFALGDGVRVTWGEATVDQHRQRVELLVGNAAGNATTAALHEKAIAMLTEADVFCLADLP